MTDVSVEPVDPPSWEQFDTVVDLGRGSLTAWAYLYTVTRDSNGEPSFHGFGYDDTADRVDFWPASTIKVYPVTAAMMLLEEEGFSIDAVATFYHESGGSWVRDLEISFREMIFETFTCSSNSTYTLLLRFAGIDWINQEFFQEQWGLGDTALMLSLIHI